MKEHIEREAALKCICSGCFEGNIIGNGFCGIPCDDYKLISEIPAADVRPVVRGKWITPTVIGGRTFNIPHCSACNGVPCGVDEHTNFCPNCGAVMEES